jgi:hypothetical protein
LIFSLIRNRTTAQFLFSLHDLTPSSLCSLGQPLRRLATCYAGTWHRLPLTPSTLQSIATLHYNRESVTDPIFNLRTWKVDVEGKTAGQSAAIKDVIIAIRDGANAHTAISEATCDTTECSSITAKRRVQDAMDKSYVRKGSDNLYTLTVKSINIR